MTGTQTALAALGVALVGGIVGYFVGVASSAAAIAAAPAGSSGLSPANSTGSLQTGWMYYVKLTGPGAPNAASYLQSLGFVDPTTKGAPTLESQGTGIETTLALYQGPLGASVPAPTAQLGIQVLGYPNPGVLSA